MKKKIYVRAAAFLLAGSLAFAPVINAIADTPESVQNEQTAVPDTSDGQLKNNLPGNVSSGEVVPAKGEADVILSGNPVAGSAAPESNAAGSTLAGTPGSVATIPENETDGSASGTHDSAATASEDETDVAASGTPGSAATPDNGTSGANDPEISGSETGAPKDDEPAESSSDETLPGESSSAPVNDKALSPKSLTVSPGILKLASAPRAVAAPTVTIAVEQGADSDKQLKATINLSGFSGKTSGRIRVMLYLDSETSPLTNYSIVSDSTTSVTLRKNLSAGNTYDVYAKVFDATDLTSPLAESTHIAISAVQQADITTENVTVSPVYENGPKGSITISGVDGLEYYKSGVGTRIPVEGNVITGLSAGDYYLYLPAHFDDGVFYFASSHKLKVTVSESDEPYEVKYRISTKSDSRVSWNPVSFELKEGDTKSFRVKPSDESLYYIQSVRVTPEDGAELTFSGNTGEVYLENVTKDVTLEAVVVEKSVPTSIEVISREFNKNGIYSESNPAIQTTIRVRVLDQNGKAVPGTRVYFKADRKDVSFAYVRESGADGIAAFVYSFAIPAENGSTDAEYNPVFAFDLGFTNVLAEDTVKLVLQKSKDMVLYESQITGTLPEKNQGVVSGVPDGYELWSGETHQGALVVGTGEWIRPTDGKFTGLSSGQHLLRLGEYYDEETGTFYFASNYKDFFVPRLIREEDSEPADDTEDDTENGNGSSTTTPGSDTTPNGSGSSQTTAPGSGSSSSSGASGTNTSTTGSVDWTPFIYQLLFGNTGSNGASSGAVSASSGDDSSSAAVNAAPSNATSLTAQSAAASTPAAPAPAVLPATRSASSASAAQTSPATITRSNRTTTGTSKPAATDAPAKTDSDSSEEESGSTQTSTSDKSSEANGKSADIQKIDDGEVALAGTLPVNDVTTQDSPSKLIIFLAILVAAAVVTVTTLLIKNGQQHKA